jgi:antitoxin ParD1/3/4
MPRNNSVTLGNHFSDFIDGKIQEGRFETISEAVRAGLRLLEADETKLEVLRATLAQGEAQLDRGEGIDGELFMQKLISGHE